MKLSDISSKPKLIELSLNDEETLAQYGEALTFHTWDRQPMNVFLRLANLNQSDTVQLVEIVKTLILNDQGQQILSDENMLPTNVLMKAIAKVTEQLGK